MERSAVPTRFVPQQPSVRSIKQSCFQQVFELGRYRFAVVHEGEFDPRAGCH
jgi:hypothetical protein